MQPPAPLPNELSDLLKITEQQTLIAMILAITQDNEDLEHECRMFLLRQHAKTPEHSMQATDAEAWALWNSIEVDLSDMDEYGGADDDIVEKVCSALDELAEVVADGKASSACRQEIQSLAMQYLVSNNSGMGDELTGLVMACCHSDAEWRELAEVFEGWSSRYWTLMAMDIYRRIGDDARYLAVRKANLDSASDYLDLAGYYEAHGEQGQAVELIEHALEIARQAPRTDSRWRLDGLIAFLSDHAKRSGDRQRHTTLEFERTILCLTLDSYLAFEKHCRPNEWAQYEQRVMEHLPRAWPSSQVDIYLHRQEYSRALAALTSGPLTAGSGVDSTQRRQAQSLESRYPQEILAYYLVKLGKLERHKRSVYAEKAIQLCHIRRLVVETMKDKGRWSTIVTDALKATQHLPAFRDELQKHIPDWPH